MAFGKKKDDAPEPELDDAIEPEAALDEPAEAGAAPDASDAVTPDAEPPVAAAPAPAPAQTGTDALLSMFQEVKTEVNDLAVLTDLAGEADIDDILEELRTLRAALGITDAFEDELATAA